MKRFLLLLFLAGTAWATDPSPQNEREFLWNQANRTMFSATEPEEFLQAAARYHELIEKGARNADVFYNLGTALLRAEQYEEAITAFERAEIYEGTTTDIRRNLELAREGLSGEEASPPVWKRTLFFWHYTLPADVRGLIAAVAFSLVWIAFAIRSMIPRYQWPVVVTISSILCVLFMSSAGISMMNAMQDVPLPAADTQSATTAGLGMEPPPGSQG